eukprot:6177175-Pleurochrysis_carterae.AAC.1
MFAQVCATTNVFTLERVDGLFSGRRRIRACTVASDCLQVALHHDVLGLQVAVRDACKVQRNTAVDWKRHRRRETEAGNGGGSLLAQGQSERWD